MATTYTECYVFIDDSNLWIPGQKATAKKLKDADTDPRFRVDLGRFMTLVAKDRHVSKAFLYGSIPPRNDTVWNAAREKNYKVNIFECSGTGKQKEVDTAMTADIVDEVGEAVHSMLDVTFIVVTGDRDLNRSIEKCLAKQMHVELWSWEDSMSIQFKRLANKEKLFTANKLDEFLDKFGYTSYMSRRDKKDIDPTHAIVYKDVPKGKEFERTLANHINKLLRLFFITCVDKVATRDLIVEFPRSNPDYVLTELKKLKGFDYQPCSYPEYSHPIPKHLKHSTYYYSAYGEIEEETLLGAALSSMDLGDVDTGNMDATEQQASGDTDTWGSVLYRTPGLYTKLKKKREMPCKWGEHCIKAADCPNSHTEYERKLFSKYPQIDFRYFKVRECNNKGVHTTHEQRRMCTFAHSNDDSWCLKCKEYGHLTQDCKAA